MAVKSSFLYALKIIFSHGTKKTVGTKSIKGAVFCIALSLIPLVLVISVSDAMINGMTDRLVNLSSSHMQLQFVYENPDSFDKALMDISLEKVRGVEGVTNAYEMISTTGLVSSNKGRTGATIRACDPEIFKTVPSYNKMFNAIEGDIKDFYESNGQTVLIGKGIAEKLQLKPGDTIRLITTQKVNDKIIPKMTSMKVGAVISCGYQELDSLWVFLPIEKGIQILKPDTSLSSIMIETDRSLSDQKGFYQLQQKIEEEVGYFVSVYRWDELNHSQFENFSSTRMLLVFIMLLIVLVACINISSCIVMICLDRRKEIAILKSVGTSNSTITMSFIFVGLMIGLAGILIGIPCGIIISLNVNNIIWFIEQIVNLVARIGYFIANGNLNSFYSIRLMDDTYYLESIPVHIPFIQILLYILATLVLSLCASFIPAYRAGKEKVCETFRKAGS